MADSGVGTSTICASISGSSNQWGRSKQVWLNSLPRGQPAFVFAYGSLMWDPGFEYEDTLPAIIYGYHRRLCIYSHVYRGTLDRPGLVFGLDRGGSCRGRVFKIAPSSSRKVLEGIWDREMIYRVYQPRKAVVCALQRCLSCYTFVANRFHKQYAGQINLAHAAAIIAGAVGKAGSNPDYLMNTLNHLEALGQRDQNLLRLHIAVQALRDGPSC